MYFSHEAVLYWRYSHVVHRVGNSEEKKLLNKVVILVFFAHKKNPRCFIKLRLNHWCHMDYFNDVLTTFLGLERGCCLGCLWRVRELSDFIKNILICVPRMNESAEKFKLKKKKIILKLRWMGTWTAVVPIPFHCIKKNSLYKNIYLVFHRRIWIIQDWNDMRVRK